MIIDTFPFNKDFAALEIRIEELKGVVDIFVASESAYTHSGHAKKLHLSNSRVLRAKMGTKLVVLANTRPYLTTNPRTREMLQRQEISKYLRKLELNPLDLIIHSDCDEIPRSEVISELHSSKSAVNVLFELDNFANYLNASAGKWMRGRAISKSLFQSIQQTRSDTFIYLAYNSRRHNLPFMRLTDFWSAKRFPFYKLPERILEPKLRVVKNAGWHFNNLFMETEILEKIQSSSHVEWNVPKVTAEAISNFKRAADIYTGEKLKIVKIDHTYPRCIRENLEEWQRFIYKEDIETA